MSVAAFIGVCSRTLCRHHPGCYCHSPRTLLREALIGDDGLEDSMCRHRQAPQQQVAVCMYTRQSETIQRQAAIAPFVASTRSEYSRTADAMVIMHVGS